jgi:hypothetical protein
MKKKILDIISKLSPREKWILGGTLLILSLFFLDRFVMGPSVNKLHRLDQQTREEENAIKKSLLVLIRKDQITIEHQAFSNYVVESKNPEEEMTLLLKEVENVASQASVSLLYDKPGNIEEKGKIKKYAASLEFESDMPKLMTFIFMIESSQKLLQVEKYEIQPQIQEKGPTQARCTMTVSKTVLLG